MRFSGVVTAAAAVQVAVAGPIQKRQSASLSENDIAVLQLANFLENLEFNLYTGGYMNFTEEQYVAAGLPAHYRNTVQLIASHEAQHRAFFTQTLAAAGQQAAPECTYSFPYSDPVTFAALANMITSTGIGAFIGAAQLIMDNPTVLTAATSVLLVESRHDSLLRRGLGANPAPNPFDTPVTALWAYSIAKNFAIDCPVDIMPVALPKLEVAPMPPPSIRPQTPAGTQITLTWDPATFIDPQDPSTPNYAFFINQVSDPIFVPAGTVGAGSATIPLPEGLLGVAFVGLSTYPGGLTAMELSQKGTLAGPMVLPVS